MPFGELVTRYKAERTKTQMKIKLFKHGVLPAGHYNGIPRTRLETNEELENRINEYMADRKVSSVQAYGDNIMVIYEEVSIV